jgi:fatty acid desaturase
MNSVDWKLHTKALSLGLVVCSKFLLAIVVGAAIISTIVTFIGWQSIPIIVMLTITVYFAWMIGHMQLDKKKWEERANDLTAELKKEEKAK